MAMKEGQQGLSEEALLTPLQLTSSKIEIPTVNRRLYAEIVKAVEQTGAFIVSIRSVSIKDLLGEDALREPGKRRFADAWYSAPRTMQTISPPEMKVFIDPKAVRIEYSNNLPTDEQKRKIVEAEARFRDQLPEGARQSVRWIMANLSMYAQIEDSWMDAGKGLLFPDYYARTDERDADSVGIIGHVGPGAGRDVAFWSRDFGLPSIFAVPVGVLPRMVV